MKSKCWSSGGFAFWSADKVSADEIAAGDSITPELITLGAWELEEVAVFSTDKGDGKNRDINSIRGGMQYFADELHFRPKQTERRWKSRTRH